MKTCVILAVAGMAAAAQAQTATTRYEVNAGSGWSSSVNVLPGASVSVRMIIDWTGNAHGMGDFLASIRVNGAGANGDSATALARTVPFNFGAQNLATYTNVANRLRIDVANGRATRPAVRFRFSRLRPRPRVRTL